MKLWTKSLMGRLVISFLLLSMVTVGLVANIAFVRARQALEQSIFERLDIAATLKETELSRWIDDQRQNVTLIAQLAEIRTPAKILTRNQSTQPKYQSAYATLSARLAAITANKSDLQELFILADTGGQIIVSTDKDHEGQYRVQDKYFIQGRKDTFVQNVYSSPVTGKPTVTIATPLLDETGQQIGVLAAHLNLTRLDQIIQTQTGLGASGSTYLVNRLNVLVSAERFGSLEFPRGIHSQGIDTAVRGINGQGLYENYAGAPVIGVYRWIGDMELVLLAEIHQEEAFAPARQLSETIILVGFISIGILAIGVYLLARQITQPILAITETATQVAAGDLTPMAPVLTQDEIGLLARTFNQMTTQLRQLYQKLQSSEEHFRSLIENISDIIAILDSDGNIRYCSPSIEQILGYSPEIIIGKSIFELVHPEDVPFCIDFFKQRVLIPGIAPATAFRLQHHKGAWLIFEVISNNRLDDPSVAGIIINARDITLRKQAETEHRQLLTDLGHRSTQLQTAAEVSKSASTILDPDELMNQIVNLIRERFDFYYVGIFLTDASNRYAVLRAGTGQAGQRMLSLGYKLPLDSETTIGWSVTNGKACIASRTDMQRFHHNPYLPGTRSKVALPLISRGKVLGALTVQSTAEETFSSEDDIIALQTIADQLAIAIENARLYQETRRRASELAALIEINRDISASLDLPTVLERIVMHARHVLEADGSEVYLLEADGLTLRAIVALGRYAEQIKASPLQMGKGIVGHIAQTGAAEVIVNVEQDPRMIHIPDTPVETHTLICAPLISRDQVIGVMSLDRPSEHGPFAQEDLQFLTSLARQAVIAIENARLYTTEQQRATALAEALERQQELDRLKNEFIQNVSHELRTPLAITRGYAELLEIGKLGQLRPSQQESVNIIARRTRMLSTLVDDLTAILEAESRDLGREQVDLTELVSTGLADFQIAAQKAGITLLGQIAPDLPPVSGDPIHLRRVLDNLLGNTFKFTPEGGSVTVRLWQEQTNLILEVADTGIGIPPDKLDRIFERFYQVDGSMTRRYGGVGLGLALVKEVVEAHEGQISVQSAPGQGSTFRVTLPSAPN